MKYKFPMNVTVIYNEFIDHYMAAAAGEYVKVYLYIMRHQHEDIQTVQIADALNHTEADVQRALEYWEKIGVLKHSDEASVQAAMQQTAAAMSEVEHHKPVSAQKPRSAYGQDEVNKLLAEEEFTQLLYIAQKYLGKVFTLQECGMYAYLYSGLSMSMELLEYLTEYCVQGGHTSIRYIETVALSWHGKGLRTVDEAKAYTSGYIKDSFAVMKAFGLNDRKPGKTEKEMIDKWFTVYGFTREVVVEACNRTMSTIHSPSFNYADKILKQWQKAGVKNLDDITKLDQSRQKQPQKSSGHKATNQFHNFEQRDTDYDAIVLDQVKSWISES